MRQIAWRFQAFHELFRLKCCHEMVHFTRFYGLKPSVFLGFLVNKMGCFV